MTIKGIKYIGPVLDGSGYAQVARDNIMALNKIGVPITVSPISFEHNRPNLGKAEAIKDLVNKDIDYDTVFMHCTPEFWHSMCEPDKVNVANTMWETNRLPKSWVDLINDSGVDKVVVPSPWNVDIFKNSGVTIPVVDVPYSIDVSEFDNIKPYTINGINNDTFVFYSVFQWNIRKDPTAMLKAYYHAFQDNENVALVFKTYIAKFTNEEREHIINAINDVKKSMAMPAYPKVCLVSSMLSRELLGLHTRGDCCFSLDRGEGWGLGQFTAGAIKKPVITTNIGAPLCFINETTGYLVDHQLTPVFGMLQSPYYNGDQLWAEANIPQASKLMLHVYNNREEAKDKGIALYNNIKTNFSPEVVANKIIKAIED